ncbi:Uu.00g044200.m01.CDS01 [Anthostomella pinea]|uniref:Uu.00g044200.m01.CDS01 n=1 Tax=Anthostomella pinea TaxID=933095 RepID=A0AAI8VBL6_9PEZI|nr:Uu.00g044200.m01.CDS01 [Anthostomella pinea]
MWSSQSHHISRHATLSAILALPLSALATPTDLANAPQSGNSEITRRQNSAGSSCEGSEGQWNCMTNTWQRCAAGQWSVVMDCAQGTVCAPSGLSYDFHVEFDNSGSSTSGTTGTAGGGTGRLISWWLVAALGGLSISAVAV